MHDNTNETLTRTDALGAVLVGLAAFALYQRTLVPFLLPSDSGEFQVLVHQLGVAHTTGYSTYLLLGHLFQQIWPWGDVAYRVNLFSALMAALTVALLYVSAKLFTGNRLAAVASALCLAVGFTFWSQAIIAEVYATGAAFVAAVLVCTLFWYRTGSRRAILMAGLLGGAGLGAHGSLAPFGLAVGLFLLLNARRWRTWLAPGVAGAAIGLALYLGGMFLVDANQAPANVFNAAYTASRSKWDLTAADVANPVTRVWFLVSAGQWRSALFANPGKDTLPGLFDYASKLPREFSLPALALALIGLAVSFRRDWRLTTFLLSALLIQIVTYVNYGVGDRYVFFIPSYLLLALFLAAGLAQILAWLARQSWGNPWVQATATILMALACLWPMVQPQWSAVRDGSIPFLHTRDYLVKPDTAGVERSAAQVTAGLEPDAIVFTNWNWLFPYYYTAHIVQGKTGVQFIETYPRAEKPGLADSVLEFIRANLADRPIYVSDSDPAFARAGYRLQATRMGPTTFYRLEAPR